MTFDRRRAGRSRPAGFVLLLAVAALVATAARPAAVSAHALLQGSDPAAGSTLGSAPPVVTLTFGETPDLRLTSVHVLDAGGGDHGSGPLEAVADPPDSIRVPIAAMADGVYTVSWRTVSAVDGHIAAGSFSFGVGVAPPTGPPSQPQVGAGQAGSPPAIAARWLLYLGLVALIGAAFVAVAVARRPSPDLLLMAAAGWVLAALGTVGVIGVQWADTGAPIEQVLATSVGTAAFARVASLGLIGAAVAGFALIPRLAGRSGWLLVGATAAVALLVDVFYGHAGAGADWLPQVGAQWLHGLASAGWMGGLAGLLLVLRSTPADVRLATARRFSFWAGIAIAAVAATGAIRALVEVGTLDALIGSDFGRVILLKSSLFLGLASLGAFNRFVTLKNAARVVTGLRRIGGAEITLAVLVFGLSALLVNLTPPTSSGATPAPVAQPIVTTGHDFGTSVRARLVATPGSAGSNVFDLAVTDFDTSEPVDAPSASLRFQLVSQSGVGASTLDLERSAPGRFAGTSTNLSIDGIWQLTATVTGTTGAVEIPLLAATTVPAQAVDRLVSTGLPTINTIHLGAAGTAQVYLDPGAPGQNELHITFFDPTGVELPVETAVVAVFPTAGDAVILSPRLLEPGHFVATIDTMSGQLTIDAVSPLPATTGSGHLHVHVTIEVSA